MTRSFTFIVPGQPTPKARPRVTARGAYTPKRTQLAEARVLEHFLAADNAPASPLDVPVTLAVHAVFDVPKSWSRKRRSAAFASPMTSRPDADNIAKLVTDALNGVLYADDAQIHALTVVKRYASTDDEPAYLHISASWKDTE